MLTAERIEDLVALRLPDEGAAELLLGLTPDRLDLSLFKMVVEKLSAAASCSLAVPSFDLLDCCGTGGSGLTHFNTSTTAAFVLAAGGVKVAKFGNRAATGKIGSADFLDAIGLAADVDPERSLTMLHEHGLAFLFAPQFYPFLGVLREIRQRIGVKTILNYVGPLLNPLRPAFRVLGVSDPIMQVLIANYLADSPNTKRALVVRGPDNLDEIAASGPTEVFEVQGPVSVASTHASTSLPDLTNPPQDNPTIFFNLLDNTADSHHTKLICTNAGAGFYISGKSANIDEGAVLASHLLQSGEVKNKYQQLRSEYARLHA
jgi:anthranilate phosphoribosyltransferase